MFTLRATCNQGRVATLLVQVQAVPPTMKVAVGRRSRARRKGRCEHVRVTFGTCKGSGKGFMNGRGALRPLVADSRWLPLAR